MEGADWRAGVGFLTGFLGVGGGFLIVPALNSAAGVLGHLGEQSVSWLIIGLLLAGGLPGLLLGTRLDQRLPVAQLRQGFAVLVILLGATLLAINLPQLLV